MYNKEIGMHCLEVIIARNERAFSEAVNGAPELTACQRQWLVELFGVSSAKNAETGSDPDSSS